ncbi:MAG TPA: NfeD family protein, partial [Pyrinomonadaceae bacterium]|nr:NfeD family protein [Pyrinomonadaceae bacterium]
MIQFLQFVVPRPASVVSFDFGWPLVALLLALVALIALLLYVALLSRHRKASTRSLAPVNRAASVEHPLTPEGAVLVGGELWRARTRG